MVHLTLAGVSEDGKRLLLVSDAGVEFTLDLDRRVRAALRGEHVRLGQLEIQMDSALRPRDIQARIRAGESPESVAQAAQTTVERIMPFAAPVLAERQHVADRAQRSSVRRKAGDTGGAQGGARTLGEATAVHLRAMNVDPTTVEWDSWRREDGRWSVVGVYATGKRKGTAQFTFDGPGNYVIAENDDARWLVGDTVATARAPESRDDLRQARQRRLSSVPEDQLPLGEDAIEMVTGPARPAERADDRADELGAEMPLEAFLDEEPVAPSARPHAADAPAEAAEPAGRTEAAEEPAEPVAPATSEDPRKDEPEPASRRPARKSRGRASVPSWDEIMFGGGKSE